MSTQWYRFASYCKLEYLPFARNRLDTNCIVCRRHRSICCSVDKHKLICFRSPIQWNRFLINSFAGILSSSLLFLDRLLLSGLNFLIWSCFIGRLCFLCFEQGSRYPSSSRSVQEAYTLFIQYGSKSVCTSIPVFTSCEDTSARCSPRRERRHDACGRRIIHAAEKYRQQHYWEDIARSVIGTGTSTRTRGTSTGHRQPSI
mmetsp:Transcript_25843/g.52488  ORF Transcript_25843/g.52488 Transcript_25843/m.52488 type:complete len:201 (-) Transcript_25843:29-631(-)